jgi:hypothetical protein
MEASLLPEPLDRLSGCSAGSLCRFVLIVIDTVSETGVQASRGRAKLR